MHRTLTALVSGLLVLGGLTVVGSPVAAAPAPETAVLGVTAVTAGSNHACARRSNGTAVCWGDNTSGQLGDNTNSVRTRAVVVLNVAGTAPLTGIRSIAAGGDHTCAVLTSNQLRCWGKNASGEIGDNSITPRFRPVVVRNPADTGPLTQVAQVSLGFANTCAALTTGQVRCWGENSDGQVGVGSVGADELLPRIVVAPTGSGPLTAVTQVSVGDTHMCARLSTAQARCWGENDAGAVGDGTTTTPRPRPVVVKSAGGGTMTGVAEVVATAFSSCARVTGGRILCFGGGTVLGDGVLANSVTPVPVQAPSGDDDLRGITQFSGNSFVLCARTGSGRARCWGENVFGQHGAGNTDTTSFPQAVRNVADTAELLRVTGVAAGFRFACASLTNGQVRCWGANAQNQLGNGGGSGQKNLPVVVSLT